MAKKSFEFMIDTIFENSQSVATVKQLDKVTFNITVTENGFEKNLSNQTISLFARKPDGKLVMQEEGINITNETAGKVSINVKNSIFQAVGYVVAELEIKDSTGEISTSNFIFKVQGKLGSNDAVHSHVDVNLFTQLKTYIVQANEDIKVYREVLEAFVSAGISAEGLLEIKQYIEDNIEFLRSENSQATTKILELSSLNSIADTKRAELQKVIESAGKTGVVTESILETEMAKKLNVSGGTMSGNLVVKKDSPRIVASNKNGDNKAIMQPSTTKGSYVFGGTADADSEEVQNYIRVGNNELVYKGTAGSKNIYHEGNKPTAGDVGAIGVNDYVIGGNGILKDISNTDIKTITRSGRYRGNNCVNAPVTGSGVWFFYDVEIWNNDFRRITAKRVSGTGTYILVCNGGTWGTWKKVYNEGDKPTASDVGAIATSDYEVGSNGAVKDISNQDIKAITKSGRYRGNNCVNAPADNTWYYFDVECHSNSGYRKITAKHFFSDKNYTIVYNNGVWTPWRLEYNQGTFIEMMKQVYPVGSIYMSTSNTNPSNLFGGTWEAWGGGRVPIGVSTTDPTFNSANLKGGNYYQELRACIGAVNSSTNALGYTPAPPIPGTNYHSGYGVYGNAPSNVTSVNHSTYVYQSDGNYPTTIQPYVTCFMWRRTAL